MAPHRPFIYQLRVGYADTDRMGFAHHSCFLVYLESARTELLRATGDSYLQWEERGILLPVTEASLQYLSPARYDDALDVHVLLTAMSRVRLTFAYRVECPARQTLLAQATTAHVFMNRQTHQPQRMPPEGLAHLTAWLEQHPAE